MKGYIYILVICVLLLGFSNRIKTEIPKIWNANHFEESIIPYYNQVKTEFLPDSIYYNIDERVIYKTYPVYLPGKEPKDYYEWLKNQKPEVVFNQSELKTDADWVAAGAEVFKSGSVLLEFDDAFKNELLYGYESLGMPISKEGIIPFYNFIIRETGKIEISVGACTLCHSKVMPDGTIVMGAQGNMPVDPNIANLTREAIFNSEKQKKSNVRKGFEHDFKSPWKISTANLNMETASNEAFVQSIANARNGVIHRTGTIIGKPVSIPDLFNLKDRKYLDHSGRVLNNGIEDIMLYATLADGIEDFDKVEGISVLPWPNEDPEYLKNSETTRYSDSQLYALAKYLYALTPPKNPNIIDSVMVKKGKSIFITEGCVTCHEPPFYTNNSLTPALGFEIPEPHLDKYSIFPISVETDPTLTMESRRGTGYYKVPSLIGLWNRTSLLHEGNITSLEELFNPKRLDSSFIPSGYMPGWKTSMAVPGHPFGLQLTNEEKKELIIFLNTL